MTQFAVNQLGQPVRADAIPAHLRGRYTCLGCGARLMHKAGRRAGHFVHVSAPDCQQAEQVEVFVQEAVVYAAGATEGFQLLPGLRALKDGKVLHFDIDLKVFFEGI